MLSVGRHMRLKTSRMVAACPRLSELFDASMWSTDQFLHKLMEAPSTSAFFRQWTQSTNATSHYTTTMADFDTTQAGAIDNDSVLWNRPWVYCDQITGQCRDAISKKDWLDPSKRLPQCVQSVVKGETSENAPIQFCLSDDSRTDLCNKVVQWNLQITTILCRAAGICPESMFAYTPTMYSVSNQEFASDTVQKFYAGLDSTDNPVCAVPASEDIDVVHQANTPATSEQVT